MRRGEIALSTNAIVTIVIALVLLVLLVVFVAGSFTNTSSSFMDSAKQSMAPRSSAVEPIKWSFDELPARGEPYIMRVSVFNDGPAVTAVTLSLVCPPGILDRQLEATAKDAPAGASMEYQAVGSIAPGAPRGSHVCSLTAQSTSGRVVATSDLILTL